MLPEIEALRAMKEKYSREGSVFVHFPWDELLACLDALDQKTPLMNPRPKVSEVGKEVSAETAEEEKGRRPHKKL